MTSLRPPQKKPKPNNAAPSFPQKSAHTYTPAPPLPPPFPSAPVPRHFPQGPAPAIPRTSAAPGSCAGTSRRRDSPPAPPLPTPSPPPPGTAGPAAPAGGERRGSSGPPPALQQRPRHGARSPPPPPPRSAQARPLPQWNDRSRTVKTNFYWDKLIKKSRHTIKQRGAAVAHSRRRREGRCGCGAAPLLVQATNWTGTHTVVPTRESPPQKKNQPKYSLEVNQESQQVSATAPAAAHRPLKSAESRSGQAYLGRPRLYALSHLERGQETGGRMPAPSAGVLGSVRDGERQRSRTLAGGQWPGGSRAPNLQHTATPGQRKATAVTGGWADFLKLIARIHPTTAAATAISDPLCSWHAN